VAISFVASASAASSSISSVPAHQADDYFICFAAETPSTSPALASGWTNISENAGFNGWRLCYKKATSSSETVGPFTGAGMVAVAIYRGVAGIGDENQAASGTASSTASWPALTLHKSSGSWIVTCGTADNTCTPGAPAGTTLREQLTGSKNLVLSDTNGAVSSFAGANGSLSPSRAWEAADVELLAPNDPLVAGSGSFALAGQAAGLNRQFNLSADGAAVSLAGQAASLLALRNLTADQGSFALTGEAVAFARQVAIAAGTGSFALTGEAASLLAARVLALGNGSFALTGQAVQFTYTNAIYTLVAGVGGFTVSGQDVELLVSRSPLVAAHATFTLTGFDAVFQYLRAIEAGYGSFVLTGLDAQLLASRLLAPAHGSFTGSGQPVQLLVQRALQAGVGEVDLTAPATFLLARHVVRAAVGEFALTGRDVGLAVPSLSPAADVFIVPAEENTSPAPDEPRIYFVPAAAVTFAVPAAVYIATVAPIDNIVLVPAEEQVNTI
jgi:hypothetical protein